MGAETKRTDRSSGVRPPDRSAGVRRRPVPTASEPEEFLHALESVSQGIRDPVVKLRFIRTSLARHQAARRVVRKVPVAPVRRVLYRWLSLEDLRQLLDTKALRADASGVNIATRVSFAFGRAAVIGLGLIFGISVGVAAYRHMRPPAAPLMAAPRQVSAPARRPRTARA